SLDGLATDSSGNNRDGRLRAVGSGAFAYAAISPFPNFDTASLRLTENGSAGAARLLRDVSEINLSDQSWTLGGWFLRATTNTEDFLFYLGSGSGHGGNGDELEIYGATDQTLRLGHYNILGASDVQLISPRLSNQWHHAALTFERTNSYAGLLRF